MNTFVNGLNNAFNYDYTANGALAHRSTNSALYDMFAFAGAYRNRDEADCVKLFADAYDENPSYTLKCLFYMRDIRDGQGERRFFRVCLEWLASYKPEAVKRNIKFIPLVGRWDDLYCLCDNAEVEDAMFAFMRNQLMLDMQSETPSLLAKWMKSENTSSYESRQLGAKTRKAMGMTSRQYRKTLSVLRGKINVLERLISAKEWDKIEFDKIPSRAGMIYRNAFARHDVERMMTSTNAISYADFAKSDDTKVNADVLYPYECVKEAIKLFSSKYSDTNRLMVNKYWDNLKDVLNGADCNMLCVCDTSGSMRHGNYGNVNPIDVAIGLSMYCAERANGPFKNMYISFASRPQLIKVTGADFVDKVYNIYRTNLCDNTDLVATFRILRKIAMNANVEDIPKTIIVISDMQIDSMTDYHAKWTESTAATEMEKIREEWEMAGLEMPKLVYWNVNASKDTILDSGKNVSFVSGCSPVIFKQVLTGKTGYDLMMEVLNADKYKDIK